MYSLQETAIILNLKESKIRSLIRRGRLKSDLVGGQRVIQKAVLYQFIQTVVESATQTPLKVDLLLPSLL